MEDLIWNYLDNTCSNEEKLQVEQLLNSDVVFRNKFNEIKALHQSLFTADLDEPSMRFTQNVMDSINTQVPVKPLSTVVDKRIINGIGFFLVGIISVLLFYILSQTTFASSDTSFNLNWSPPDVSKIFSSNFTTVFLMFDCVLLLFLFDKYLRKRMSH